MSDALKIINPVIITINALSYSLIQFHLDFKKAY